MKELQIENSNNKLQCQGFVHISFAPPVSYFDRQGNYVVPIKESSFDQVYLIKHEEKEIFVKLINFTRLKFWQISCVDTIAGYGLDSFDWKKQFKEKYPDCDEETEMAVYCYLKEK